MEKDDRFMRLTFAAAQKVAERDYWLGKLSGDLVRSVFPPDYKATGESGTTGHSTASREKMEFCLDDGLSAMLMKIGAGTGIKLFMVLAAFVTLLLAKYTQEEDIIIGVPVTKPEKPLQAADPAGANTAAGENGMQLINTVLALRNRVETIISFKELLYRVRQSIIEAENNCNFPLEILMNLLGIASANPGESCSLFDTAVLLEGIHERSYLDNIDISVIFSFRCRGSQVEGHIEYKADVYQRSSIERLALHMQALLRQVLTTPDTPICQLEMVSEDEKRQLLIEFNDMGQIYPNHNTIHGLFTEQAAKTPDAIALDGPDSSSGGSELVMQRYQLTYAELDRQTDRFAAFLNAKGVKPGDITGLLVNRTNRMIYYIIAILKAGAAYLPINPTQPPSRMRFMLADCAVTHLLTISNLEDIVKALEMPGIEKIEGDRPEITHPIRHNSSFIIHNCYTPLAYIIYTSGSTGNPKGVAISHRNISPLLCWGQELLGLTNSDRVIQNLSYYFDWSVWEIFITLISGASLYMIDEKMSLDGRAVLDFLVKNDITVLHITPTHFQYLLNACKRQLPLRHLCLGAEKLTYDLVKRSMAAVKQECRSYNMYGPTEATIISAVLTIDPLKVEDYIHLSSVPIGKTIGNTKLYILDKNLHCCPINVTGELYIGGDALSIGYINNPELTAEKFIALGSPATLYKTGDRCRWLADGTVEFLGRFDFQVKIRGNRIETGEIENKILQHEAVKETVVVAKTDDNGENYLCAYIVTRSRGDTLAAPGENDHNGIIHKNLSSTIREYLSSELPAYMIPAYFIEVPVMPLNANGKIDLKALPEPQAGTGSEVPYAPPRTELEKVISSTWCEVLGLEKVGIHDNFFDIGGNSLRVMKVNELIKQRLAHMNIDISTMSIFLHPTIAEMTRHLGHQETGKEENPGRSAGHQPTALKETGINSGQRSAAISAGRNRLQERRRSIKP